MASTSSNTQFDVYLSYHRDSVRSGLVDYLYNKLNEEGLSIFRVDDIKPGASITKTIRNAIYGSKLYMLVFSNEYATSPSILDELEQIMELREVYRRPVIPIYSNDLDQSVVGQQTGLYGEAFAKHESCPNVRMAKVKEWRRALAEAAGLRGLSLKVYRTKAEFTKIIVEVVKEKLNSPMQVDGPCFSGITSLFRKLIGMISTNHIKTHLTFCGPKISAMAYDVCLSYCGERVRNDVYNLFKKLSEAGYRTFLDDEKIKPGEPVDKKTKNAIHRSRMYILVFSEEYSTSVAVLDHLAKIMELHKVAGRPVIPLYLDDLDASVVGSQTGKFYEAFAKHERCAGVTEGKVKAWRGALAAAADIKGLVLKDNRTEGNSLKKLSKKSQSHAADANSCLSRNISQFHRLIGSSKEGDMRVRPVHLWKIFQKKSVVRILLKKSGKTNGWNRCWFVLN